MRAGRYTWRAALVLCGASLTWAAFFLADVSFWLALAPLGLGIVIGTRTARAIAMACFILWSAAISGIGLIGTGSDPWLVWPGAVTAVAGLALLSAFTGITGAALLLLLIPVFPASPLLPLADALGGLPYPGLWGLALLAVLAALETGAPGGPGLRAALLGLALVPIPVWQWASPADEAPTGNQTTAGALSETMDATSGWREMPVPEAITERGRWLLLRERLPEGAAIVLGENVFGAEDTEALAFWCRAAANRNLTLLAGVAEPYGDTRRGAVWRLSRETCAPGRRVGNMAIHRAAFGIPHLTGTWSGMTGSYGGTASPAPGIAGPWRRPPAFRGTDPREEPLPIAAAPRDPLPPPQDWLICLEAFLPWAWGDLLFVGPRTADTPILVLSNDRAFGRHADAMATVRRKAARAMAGLTRRPIYHAETGRTFLTDHERSVP